MVKDDSTPDGVMTCLSLLGAILLLALLSIAVIFVGTRTELWLASRAEKTELYAHALRIFLAGTLLFIATLFATVCGAELGRPKAMQSLLGSATLFPKSLALAVGALAVISRLFWIQNGWVALGVWLVAGALIGWLVERIGWSRKTPEAIAAFLKHTLEQRDRYYERLAVKQLLKIYRLHPEGFVRGTGGPEVEMIRRIGAQLNKEGGMAKMLKVHESFAARCTVFGAARNLEHIWDGIGEWLG